MTSKIRMKSYVKEKSHLAFKLCAPKKATPLHPDEVRTILALAELSPRDVREFVDSALGLRSKSPTVSLQKDGRKWTYEACDDRIKLLLDTRLGKFGYELGEDTLGVNGEAGR